mgnify:CR=1 FL=1
MPLQADLEKALNIPTILANETEQIIQVKVGFCEDC